MGNDLIDVEQTDWIFDGRRPARKPVRGKTAHKKPGQSARFPQSDADGTRTRNLRIDRSSVGYPIQTVFSNDSRRYRTKKCTASVRVRLQRFSAFRGMTNLIKQ
jgi:hypothetical protein